MKSFFLKATSIVGLSVFLMMLLAPVALMQNDIYAPLQDIKDKVKILIICNDEDFEIVKLSLSFLLKDYSFEIINITEYRKRLGRDIGSLADNYARVYRRRALKPTRLSKGKKLNIIQVNYKTIKECWEKLDKK